VIAELWAHQITVGDLVIWVLAGWVLGLFLHWVKRSS
jgi:hypothetical protein